MDKLFNKGIIDQTTLDLAKSEALPGKPQRLPQAANHLLNRSVKAGFAQKRIRTSIENELQLRLNELVEQNYLQLKQNEIHNLAILILDNKSNQVLAYVGNSKGSNNQHGYRVDIIDSKRSTGSLLKPFLYGLAWQDGLILPNSLLADIPTQFGGYAPKNFNKKYEGAVASEEALRKSLNVPAVRLLKDYGLERFYDQFQKFPVPSINKGANHYGLSIMLGGAEASLWEMCNVYKGMSGTLSGIVKSNYQYRTNAYQEPSWFLDSTIKVKKTDRNPDLKAGAIWQVVNCLQDLNRPGQEQGWENFTGSRKVAWKTGTSFGLRDAWSIGICPEYTIGVWVGNADGEGRPGLTGLSSAAPLMFQAFNLLPNSTWYEIPHDELVETIICSESGYLKGLHCNKTDTILAFENANRVKNCPYQISVQLNQEKIYRVNSSCYPVSKMQTESFMVLPPLMEWYYKKREPNYKPLPNWASDCKVNSSNPMEFISPESADQVLIPTELGGAKGRLVVKVAHNDPGAIIYWHLDDLFLSETKGNHSLELNPSLGKHIITLVDESGNTTQIKIEVIK